MFGWLEISDGREREREVVLEGLAGIEGGFFTFCFRFFNYSRVEKRR